MAFLKILTPEQKKFRAAFEDLLGVDAGLLPTVKRWLNRYGLHQITPFEILSEVYENGIKTIEKGQIIEKPNAWVRTVAFRKVANKMRNQYKDKKYSNFIELDAIDYIDNIEYEIVFQNIDEDAVLDKQILLEKLLKAYDELKPEDQMIFDLRFKQDLSWKDIRKHLAISGI